jgi:uncharacterized protein (TIGR02231 family)
MRMPSTTAAVLLVFASAATAAPQAAARPAAASGEIDSVVVFADRARVTRTRTVHCEKGTARAAFERLPAALDVRTLRGEVREAADVIGLSSEVVNEKDSADPRARGLAADLDRTENQIKGDEARKAAIAAELEDVGAFGGVFAATLTEEIRNPKPNTPAWAKTLEALRARRATLAEERRKLDVALRGLQLTANRLRRQLASVGGAGERAYRTAAVTVDCRALSQVTATVSYVVGGAGWQPEYDVDVAPRGRAKTGPAAARLTVGALVRQTTGEDWTNVRLMLSTARPKLGSEAPQPAPLVIDGYEQARGKVLVQAQERREQLDAGGGGGARSGPRAAALDDKGNAFVLTLPHPVTVVADGRPVWAPVDVVETQATVKLVATPRLDEHVYQVAALKNPAAYPLLEGRVRSYRNGSYVGDSRLRHQGVGAPFEVSLGIDEELKVERRTLDDKDKSAGFLSSTKHIFRGYRSKLTNRAAGPETVELRESIPVSKIDDVKVELLARPTTAGYQLDAARGFITWTVKLVNGEWRNIDHGYAIHLPDSWQVPGQ